MAVLLPTLRKFHASALLSLLQEPAPGLTHSPPAPRGPHPGHAVTNAEICSSATPVVAAHQQPHQGIQGSALRMLTPLPKLPGQEHWHLGLSTLLKGLPEDSSAHFFLTSKTAEVKLKITQKGRWPAIVRVPHFLWTKPKNLICLLPQDSEVSLSPGGFSMSLKKQVFESAKLPAPWTWLNLRMNSVQAYSVILTA